MTLTPQERLEAYKYALERVEANASLGVCNRFSKWLWDRKHIFLGSGDMENMFPEFWNNGPEVRLIFWWPLGSPLRILALEHCILEVGMRIEFEKQFK